MQAYQDHHSSTPPPGLILGMNRHAIRRRSVPRGSRIFDKYAPPSRPYTVAAGEVMILRDGRLVDLVEAGELLDPRIWQGATAVARTDCTLALLNA